ncbi:MAG: LysE family translocator [Ilumatobacteraceae bacterium]
MPPLSTIPVFVAASTVLLLIPGPAVLYIVARSTKHGVREGLISMTGVHTASLVHAVAAVAGLSTLLVASSAAFTVVKVLGGVYLMVIGIRALLRAHASSPVEPVAPSTPRRLFVDGFVVNLFNPKVALFFLAFLPQFVDDDGAAVWSQTLALGLIYILLGVCSDGLYAVVGGVVGARFRRVTADRLRAFRYAEGLVLTGLGALTLSLPHRRPAR